MSAESPGTDPSAAPRIARDVANWARSGIFGAATAPPEAIDLHLEGRKATSPLQGFGRLWQKHYRMTLPSPAPAPAAVISTWKAEFPAFWPRGNHFYGPLTGIAPGEVALLNLAMPGGVQLSTGVLVLYADDESFTLMTPPGHMFAGWTTFASRPAEDGTLVEVSILIRASDPLYEVGLSLGGHRKEDRFWEATLTTLGARFGATGAAVDSSATCVDRRRQWRYASNIRHNAALRTSLYAVTHPRRRRPPPVT
jgi:hypothetical protein